jgi:hypothetical protein
MPVFRWTSLIAGAAQPAVAASVSCPWVGSSATISPGKSRRNSRASRSASMT